MTTAVQDKVDERAGIWDQMAKLMTDHGPDLSAEKAAEYDRLEAQFDTLETTIERINNHAERAKNIARTDRKGVVPGVDTGEITDEQDAEYSRVFAEFIKAGMPDLEPADKKILRDRFVDAKTGGFQNAAGVGTGSAGGFAVPPLFRDVFVEQLKWYGPMLQESEVLRTDSGASLPWPTNDDTGNMGAILAENVQVGELDVVLGTAALPTFMYTSLAVRVSFQMLNDVPGFDTWLARKLGERVGRKLNRDWTIGVGTTEPFGIVTSGTVRATGVGSIATLGPFQADQMIDLVEAIDPAYGNSANLKWMMHQSARKAVRKLKDTQGRYLFEASIQNGVPDNLFGYPLVLNNDMATTAVNSKSALFGDIRTSYLARIVNDLTLMRLDQRWADFLQVGFLAFERAGGVVQNTSSYGILQSTPTA